MTASSGASPVANGYQIHSQYPPLPGFAQLLPLFSSPHLHPPLPLLLCLGNPLFSTAVRACSRVLRVLVLLLLSRSRCVSRRNPRFSSARSVWTRPPEIPSSRSWRISLVKSFSAGPNSVQTATLAPIAATIGRPFRLAIRPLSLVCSILRVPAHR